MSRRLKWHFINDPAGETKMAKRHTKTKLVQRIFEVRYEQGYRYLDRCGDAMVILEDTLPAVTDGKVWMQEQMQPTGATIKCPECDLTVTFDTARLCVDQNPVDVQCPFENVCKHVFTTVASKFNIKKLIRFGQRQFFLNPTDSIDEADRLSVKKSPLKEWAVVQSVEDMEFVKGQAVSVLELPDKSAGIRMGYRAVFTPEAPLRLDERLTTPPHLLAKGQKEALLEQLQRQRSREHDPVAGLLIDIDYYWNKDKTKIELIDSFFEEAKRKTEHMQKQLNGR